MDALVASIVNEVRIREGLAASTPVPDGLAANVELRIRDFMRQSLGLKGSDSHDEALREDSLGSSLRWEEIAQTVAA